MLSQVQQTWGSSKGLTSAASSVPYLGDQEATSSASFTAHSCKDLVSVLSGWMPTLHPLTPASSETPSQLPMYALPELCRRHLTPGFSLVSIIALQSLFVRLSSTCPPPISWDAGGWTPPSNSISHPCNFCLPCSTYMCLAWLLWFQGETQLLRPQP